MIEFIKQAFRFFLSRQGFFFKDKAMKRFLTILLLQYFFTGLFAQNMIIYERKLNFNKSNYILYINDTLSYWQYVKDVGKIDSTLTLADGKKIRLDHHYDYIIPELEAYPYKRYVLKDRKNKIVYYMEFRPTGRVFYHVKDSLFPMSWKELPDKKFIMGFMCNAAETFFRGRKYVAYYTPEIPIPEGPWKFGGLPGLILVVEEGSGELHWKVKKIIKNYQSVPEMPPLNEYNFITRTEYVDQMKKFYDKTIKKRRAELIRQGETNRHAIRIIQEEIYHPVHSFSGVTIIEGDTYGKESDSENTNLKGKNRKKKKKKRKKSH